MTLSLTEYSEIAPQIVSMPKKNLVGMRVSMSYAHNKTKELWQRFMPRRDEVAAIGGANLYSVEVYPDSYFSEFSFDRKFEKWAAVEINIFSKIPEKMHILVLPSGMYGLFIYRGSPIARTCLMIARILQ